MQVRAAFNIVIAHTAPKYLENIVRLPKYFETYHYPHSTEYCRNLSEIFPIIHCN